MTPHNEANNGDFAKTVLMPGDPLRAKYIAEKFLENAKMVNSVRNIYAYTGTYKGIPVSVMASGMGIPSIGIYAYELYKFYGVENIIRIGSCGGYSETLNLFDLIMVKASFTQSNFAFTFNEENCHMAKSSTEINEVIEQISNEINIPIVKGNVLCSECFDLYIVKFNEFISKLPEKFNIIGAEMESFGLFYLAKVFNKKAACLLTVVDIPSKQNQVSAKERESSLDNMIKLALESAIKLDAEK